MAQDFNDPDGLRSFRNDVVDGLVSAGVRAEHWHSGGGIYGVQVSLQSGAHLFGTLSAEENDAWLGFDWNRWDGELLGEIEMQARPYGSSYGDADVDEVVEAVRQAVAHLR